MAIIFNYHLLNIQYHFSQIVITMLSYAFSVLFKIILNFKYSKYRQATNVNYLNVLKQHIKHAVGLSHTGTDKTQKQSHIHNNAVPTTIHYQ